MPFPVSVRGKAGMKRWRLGALHRRVFNEPGKLSNKDRFHTNRYQQVTFCRNVLLPLIPMPVLSETDKP